MWTSSYGSIRGNTPSNSIGGGGGSANENYSNRGCGGGGGGHGGGGGSNILGKGFQGIVVIRNYRE